MTPTEYREAVAAEIRALLGRRNRTRSWLADAIGISKATMTESLEGRRAFTTDELFRIAIALNVSPADLLATPPTSAVAS